MASVEHKQDSETPWVEKYRPKKLTDVISHTNIIATITRFIEQGKLPHLLFYGPPGTGKTSAILACARQLCGDRFKSSVLELNASDDRGIGVVREQIKSFASSKSIFASGIKLVILDEADGMNAAAQMALRRVIEKYTKNTRFCLICNYINKIIPPLQSRCMRFRFAPLEKKQVRARMLHIARLESVTVANDKALDKIIALANGDMRRCLTVLQAAHNGYGEVSVETVCACTGKPLPSDVTDINQALLNRGFQDAYKFIRHTQHEKGISLEDLLSHLHELALRTSYPPPVLAFLLEQMAAIEARLARGADEGLQLGALVGAYTLAKQRMGEIAKLEGAGEQKSMEQ